MYYSSGNYEAFARPVKPEGVDDKSAYIIGSGLGALAAACFLVRDGQMKGEKVHILEKDSIPGGACDGYKYDNLGYVMRGGREMDNHFECMWDLFRSIPSIETEGVSVLDEYYWLNKKDPNYSLMRATVNRGEDAHTDKKFGLSDKGAMEILKLFFTPNEELYDKKITDFFDDEVLNSNFWLYWRTMFAFENWHSALEMKLYIQRYIHHIGGLPDFTALRFTKYNQYESMILPMIKYLEGFGVQFHYNTKVENVEGLSNLNQIIDLADGQMIARGDMATETDFTEPPVVQKKIIKLCNKECKPVITATQMLESMTHQPLPTRAEASDVANAVYDRTGAIMLSGECAQGDYPVECVKTMVKIANRVEPEVNYWKRFDENDDVELDTLAKNVAYATCVTAKNMKADAIVCYTHSGSTARNLAGLGAGCPILAITDNKRTFHQLGLVWNVTPIFVDAKETINKTIEAGIEKLKSKEILEKGDLVIIAGGDQIMKDTESSVNKTLGGVLRV